MKTARSRTLCLRLARVAAGGAARLGCVTSWAPNPILRERACSKQPAYQQPMRLGFGLGLIMSPIRCPSNSKHQWRVMRCPPPGRHGFSVAGIPNLPFNVSFTTKPPTLAYLSLCSYKALLNRDIVIDRSNINRQCLRQRVLYPPDFCTNATPTEHHS